MLLSAAIQAQKLKPKFALDYFTTNSVVFSSTKDAFQYTYPNYRVRMGCDLTYKKFTLYFDQHIYMKSVAITKFDPYQAYWYVGCNYKVSKNIKISYEHLCIHPITYFSIPRDNLFGGYNMISISYGY